jgi:hypothetical protein
MNPDFKDLADDIYRRRVLRARRMSLGEKLATSFELLDEANQTMRNQVLIQNPDLDADLLDEQVARLQTRYRAISDRGIFKQAAA